MRSIIQLIKNSCESVSMIDYYTDPKIITEVIKGYLFVEIANNYWL